MSHHQLTRQCPKCGAAAKLDERGIHYCWICQEYIARLEVMEVAVADLPPRNPALDMPEDDQRRWYRWLTRWGPRLASWVRGRLR